MKFSQPAWVPDTGLPYPGAETVAAQIAEDQAAARRALQAEVDKERILARRLGEQKAEQEVSAERKLTTIRADSVTPKRVRWLWAPGEEKHGRIPLGELTILVGRGGVGKSTLLCELAAWISIGDMSGEFWRQPKDVLYVANEDSLEYTVVPRLMAARADRSRIHFLAIEELGEERSVILPTDCERIEARAKEHGAVAIMLDPLSSNMRVDNGNDPRKVRPVVEAIRRMCERSGMACIGLAHTRKQSSSNLMDAILGSSELGNVCRSAMGVMLNEDSDPVSIVLSQEKSNLGRTDIPSYEYRIVTETLTYEGELISTGRVKWIGKTDVKVSDMLHDQMVSPGSSGSAVSECVQWLRDYLTFHGTTPRAKLKIEAGKEGYPEHTLKRAGKKLGIVPGRQGFPSSTVWSLPQA